MMEADNGSFKSITIRCAMPNTVLPMVLKTEPNIKPFFFYFPVQPRFFPGFLPVVDRFLGF